MQVYQIRIKLYMLTDVALNRIQTNLTAFIDKGFLENEELLQMHEENKFKNYCYDLPYPIEKDKIYKKGKIYTVTIRTIDPRLAKYFQEVCVNSYTDEVKGLTSEIRIIPKKVIDSIYTLTPVILKDDKGYWRKHMQLAEFENQLKVNLIKKWNAFTGEKLSEDFNLYTLLEFLNETPVPMENKTAQKLAYMALGTGLLNMNSRGAGYVNYRWL